jgi:hypothetical protein
MVTFRGLRWVRVWIRKGETRNAQKISLGKFLAKRPLDDFKDKGEYNQDGC